MSVNVQDASLLPRHYAVEIPVLLPCHRRQTRYIGEQAVVIRRHQERASLLKLAQGFERGSCCAIVAALEILENGSEPFCKCLFIRCIQRLLDKFGVLQGSLKLKGFERCIQRCVELYSPFRPKSFQNQMPNAMFQEAEPRCMWLAGCVDSDACSNNHHDLWARSIQQLCNLHQLWRKRWSHGLLAFPRPFHCGRR